MLELFFRMKCIRRTTRTTHKIDRQKSRLRFKVQRLKGLPDSARIKIHIALSFSEQAERLSLPDQIQEVIQRFMSESEQQLASYRAELSRSQQETLIGTMVSHFSDEP